MSCCLSMGGVETRTALTDSFRLERGGQFESGFQMYIKAISGLVYVREQTPCRPSSINQ
jgi:hypothetical protein